MKFEFSEHTTAYVIAKRNLAEQVAQPTGKTGKTNLGPEAKELATLLEKALVGDFDTTKVSAQLTKFIISMDWISRQRWTA